MIKSDNSHILEWVIPGLAGFGSKLVSICVTFPIEYMATLSQADMASKQKNLTNGFGYVAYRELLFSAVFWSVQEEMYHKLQKHLPTDREAYVTSSFISSMTASLISYPFDLFKTWKISYPEKLAKRNAFAVCRDIYREKGIGCIFVGLPPRVIRVGVGNLIFFYLYTQTVQHYKEYKAKNKASQEKA